MNLDSLKVMKDIYRMVALLILLLSSGWLGWDSKGSAVGGILWGVLAFVKARE